MIASSFQPQEITDMKGKPAKKMMAKKAVKKMAGKDMKGDGAKKGLMARLAGKEM